MEMLEQKLVEAWREVDIARLEKAQEEEEERQLATAAAKYDEI